LNFIVLRRDRFASAIVFEADANLSPESAKPDRRHLREYPLAGPAAKMPNRRE
jgi:hypothetical protein